MTGNAETLGLAYWAGNPTNVSTASFNVPKGTIVIDTTNAVAYQKTSALGDNTGYSLVATGSGALTPTSIAATGVITSSSPSAGIGYATGSGGTVTQITSSSTGVTLSKVNGQITTVSLTTAHGAVEVFTVTNTTIAATDIPSVAVAGYAGAGVPVAFVKNVVANAFDIVIFNAHASAALNAAVTINFYVANGVAA